MPAAYFLLLAPRNLLLGFLWLYRRLISPLYGQVCRYHPSCSAYAVEAIQYHGAARGVALASWRVLRCNPWSRGGIDDPPGGLRPHYVVTKNGFVVPRKEGGLNGNN